MSWNIFKHMFSNFDLRHHYFICYSAITFCHSVHLWRNNVNVNQRFFRFLCRYRFAGSYLVFLPSLHHFVIFLPGDVVPHPVQVSTKGRQIWTEEESQGDHAAYQSHHGTSGDGRWTGVGLGPTDRHPELLRLSQVVSWFLSSLTLGNLWNEIFRTIDSNLDYVQ